MSNESPLVPLQGLSADLVAPTVAANPEDVPEVHIPHIESEASREVEASAAQLPLFLPGTPSPEPVDIPAPPMAQRTPSGSDVITDLGQLLQEMRLENTGALNAVLSENRQLVSTVRSLQQQVTRLEDALGAHINVQFEAVRTQVLAGGSSSSTMTATAVTVPEGNRDQAVQVDEDLVATEPRSGSAGVDSAVCRSVEVQTSGVFADVAVQTDISAPRATDPQVEPAEVPRSAQSISWGQYSTIRRF